MLSAISFLVIIGTVVAIHELGHYLAARMCGVGVLKFSIGFGPKIWSKVVGATEYQISIIPLGGYVRMVGDMPDLITGKQATDDELRAEEKGEAIREGEVVEDYSPEVKALIADKSNWFIYKSFWQKFFIVFAGPLFNFILAFVIAVGMAMSFGLMDTDGTKIGAVLKDSPAAAAGLQINDQVLSVDGKEVKNFAEIQQIVNGSHGKPLSFQVNRNGEIQNLNAVAEEKSMEIPGSEPIKSYMIGISAATIYKDVPIDEAFLHSGIWLYRLGSATVSGMVGLITGSVPLDSIGGPIMIYQVAGDKAGKGLPEFLGLLAYINLSLGLLNLMPIPVLDGGHLLIFTLEGIFGTISTKKKEFVQAIGMAALLLLMLVAFRNDLTRDTGKLLNEEASWNDE